MKRFSPYASALLLFFSLIVLSCKKDSDEPLKDYCDEIDIVSAYTYPDNKPYPIARLTYDGMGRISLVQSEHPLRYEFTYFDDRIEVKATENNGRDASLTYFLDDKGRIQRTSVYNYDFKYDAEGHLVSFKKPFLDNGVISGSVLTKLEYQKGSLASIHYGEGAASLTFTYYEQPNQELGGYNSPLFLCRLFDDNTTFYLIEAGYFGKSSAQLLKRINGEGMVDGDIKYLFDKKGRIISSLNRYGFQYQCD